MTILMLNICRGLGGESFWIDRPEEHVFRVRNARLYALGEWCVMRVIP